MNLEENLKIPKECIYEDEELIIPHVDIQHRDFVLKPMVQLNSNFRHLILQKTMKELLDLLENR